MMKSLDVYSFVAGAGICLAWKRDSFELFQRSGELPYTDDFVPIGDFGAVKNFDLFEERILHSPSESPTQMNLDDRRHVGLVHLLHRASQKSLMVVVAHLMTDSRDNMESNLFPGEVRAHELSSIRTIVQTEYQLRLQQRSSIDAAIVTGDFNISLSAQKQDDEFHVLRGHLQTPDGKCQRNIETGFVMQEETGKFVLSDWLGRAGAKPRELHEAFDEIHRWGQGVGPGGACSSFSSKRCNWIDLMFYSADSLELKKVSRNETPPSPIPAKGHPSDHLPIAAMFEFRSE
jgi:hypothetical protein